jgi:hypothetical protein
VDETDVFERTNPAMIGIGEMEACLSADPKTYAEAKSCR